MIYITPAGAGEGGGALPTRYYHTALALKLSSYCGVAQGKMHWVEVGILKNPWLSAAMLEFFLEKEWVTFTQLRGRFLSVLLHQCRVSSLGDS